jgi:hypothetical protein
VGIVVAIPILYYFFGLIGALSPLGLPLYWVLWQLLRGNVYRSQTYLDDRMAARRARLDAFRGRRKKGASHSVRD